MIKKLKYLLIIAILLVMQTQPMQAQSVQAQNIADSSFATESFYDATSKLRMIKFRHYGQELMQNYEYDLNGNLLNSTTDWYKDTFESGQFNSTRYYSGYPNNAGNVTGIREEVINGNYSVYGESPRSQDWWEFLHSDRSKLRFEPNTTYQIKFKYKINMVSDNNSYFYFLARAAGSDHSKDRGSHTWTGQVGEVGNKVVTFTTGPAHDYYLIWGIHYGGAMSIDDIQIKKVSESFESGSYAVTPFTQGHPAHAGSITNIPSKVVSGSSSILGESSSSQEWWEFLYTNLNKQQFEPNTTYQVSFNYKVNIVSDRDGYFYFLARASDGDHSNDRGSNTWIGKEGEVGNKVFTFTTGPSNNYYLIWGIHYGGSLSIDDVEIKKVEESFESGDYLVAPFTRGAPAYAGRITNDPSKVISGKYSILGESESSVEWLEFLHSDKRKLQFEPNTTYQVKFNFKINQNSDQNGNFYFLARSLDGQVPIFDRGGTTWTGEVGEIGKKTVLFTTGDSPNYYLIWGVHRGGSLSIDDVNIQKMS
ncbi:hypothetical protein [Paenibacillus sp. L3-i20]|uniref:hypothetical protein n=1 Tax=Paenibacillus sp. L3-i20 TaxID=2905833 RepID=UPI00208A968E|nr:hypothetical protein [Paenibacillus sp. L3-i20]GKU75972.1 hypothetical protein L3i20_v203690 [Paenibacillus sp. L3-i20]